MTAGKDRQFKTLKQIKMYKITAYKKTSIKVNKSYQGERIETKIERIVNNNEPITDGAPLVYTERKDGVMPAYDIRTDRFEIAVDAMDKVQKAQIAKREERAKSIGEKAKEGMDTEQKGEKKIGDQSTPGTDNNK